jgi:hypothetical protein
MLPTANCSPWNWHPATIRTTTTTTPMRRPQHSFVLPPTWTKWWTWHVNMPNAFCHCFWYNNNHHHQQWTPKHPNKHREHIPTNNKHTPIHSGARANRQEFKIHTHTHTHHTFWSHAWYVRTRKKKTRTLPCLAKKDFLMICCQHKMYPTNAFWSMPVICNRSCLDFIVMNWRRKRLTHSGCGTNPSRSTMYHWLAMIVFLIIYHRDARELSSWPHSRMGDIYICLFILWSLVSLITTLKQWEI